MPPFQVRFRGKPGIGARRLLQPDAFVPPPHVSARQWAAEVDAFAQESFAEAKASIDQARNECDMDRLWLL
eukprot:5898418-Alexandrium_andersonii.AAC.1